MYDAYTKGLVTKVINAAYECGRLDSQGNSLEKEEAKKKLDKHEAQLRGHLQVSLAPSIEAANFAHSLSMLR